MEDASGIDLTQFKRWYEQAGTPRLDVRDRYDAATRTYELTVTQSCPPTPGQPTKLPMHMPLVVGLLDAEGPRSAAAPRRRDRRPRARARVLSLRKETEVFRFLDVPASPVPSLGRDFSAPVIIDYAYSDEALQHLLSYDSDPFNRWEAGQRLAMNLLLQGRGRPSRRPPGAVPRLSGPGLRPRARGRRRRTPPSPPRRSRCRRRS